MNDVRASVIKVTKKVLKMVEKKNQKSSSIKNSNESYE
jgi:hypothetical protein